MNKDSADLVIVSKDIDLNYEIFFNPLYIGVETGILKLVRDGKHMLLACGDFDSLLPKEVAITKKHMEKINVPLIQFSTDKLYLDSELALMFAIEEKLPFNRVFIVADGKRWDMIWGNAMLLNKYQQYNLTLLGDDNCCFLISTKKQFQFESWMQKYEYVSFFNNTNKNLVIRLSGFKYGNEETLTIKQYENYAISNEFNHHFPKITIKKGYALMFLAKDKIIIK